MSLRNEQFASQRAVDSGINCSSDPQDIADGYVADSLNMYFRNGYPESRPGSKLKWSKPDGESNSLLNLFRTRDSLGANYTVAIYAPNFYVHDDENDQWIKINHGYNPSSLYKSYLYGYVNWNAGKSADVLYCGNGQETTIKWPIILKYLTISATAADTSITVDDGTYFPATGNIILKESGGSEVYASYTSVAGNVLTLSGALGTAVASGAAVTFEIDDVSSIPSSNIFAKYNGRLLVAGKPKYETVIYGSVINNPEDFTTTGHADSSFNKPITDGNGGITSMHNFGEYVLVTKTDSAYKVSIIVDQANDSFLVEVNPVFSDASLGPITNAAGIKKNNDLLFATLSEGLFSLTPGNTGSITSVSPNLIASEIQNLYGILNFENSRAVSWNQFVFWTAATSVVSDTVIVLDLLKTSIEKKPCWTRFNNWGVQDWLIYKDDSGEKLYFGNRTDGNIYETFTTDYVDLQTTTSQTPYSCSFLTKRYDYGYEMIPLGQNPQSRYSIAYASHPDKLKIADLLHMQGYMSTTGTLYVDIMYDENGRFVTITKQINGTDDLVYQPKTTAQAMAMLGLPIMEGSIIDDLNTLGFFNLYIPLPIKYGFTNIQFKFYTTDSSMHWGLTGWGYNGILKDAIPAQLVQIS